MSDPEIDKSINSFLQSYGLAEIHHSHIHDIKPTQIDNVYYAIRTNAVKPSLSRYVNVMLLLLGSSEECTPTLVSEFARKYSLPTNKYNNDTDQFRRYSKWLTFRNKLICGFTKNDGNYYMVAYKRFYDCYSLYGFCDACGVLRCSPVWCICGHQQISSGWTSKNKRLDEFIRKTQSQTNSANQAYLEWIALNYIIDGGYNKGNLHGFLPIIADNYVRVRSIPLEITDEIDDSYFDELCDEHPDLLTTDIWATIGFIYDTFSQKYCLIKVDRGLCLACIRQLEPRINAFCYCCKASIPPNRTTGNKALDLFIMESWDKVEHVYDSYIQWIDYSLLTDTHQMTSLSNGCTHIAKWLEPAVNEWTKVMLKKIVGSQDAQLFDFYQLTKEYPTILTPDNAMIVGITQEPSTQEYYLVFYHELRPLLDRIVQHCGHIEYALPYEDFDEFKEIGSGGYKTVYTAKYSGSENFPRIVALKRFKNFDLMRELFISEFRNIAKCKNSSSYYPFAFVDIYGITQNPETEDYMIVMQYANKRSLMSYLDQNIDNLTWLMKLKYLSDIVYCLEHAYRMGLVHCNLHGGNIVVHDNMHDNEMKFLICDFSLSQTVNSHSITRGVLPFIAPEVFHTYKFTQKSDVYSFGIVMYLMATGEQPFKDRQFDRDLMHDIMGGLRPKMPDSAPEEYKHFAELCCNADPDKRPDLQALRNNFCHLINIGELGHKDDAWNTIYHKLEHLSCSDTSKLGDLPKLETTAQ